MELGISLGLTRLPGGGWSIGDLFANGKLGGLLDPSDLTTIFQDAAGTTPANQPGHQVRRMNSLAGSVASVLAPTDAARPVLGREPRTGRRNLLTQTENFADAFWTKSNATITANAASSPDGTMTADLVTKSASGGYVGRNYPFGEQQFQHTSSIYSKKSGSTFVFVSVRTASGANPTFYVNLDTGEIFNISAASGAVGFSAVDVGDGWWRVSVDGAVTGSGATPWFRIYPAENGVVTGTSGSILVWGAQMELGAVATPYQRVGNQWDVTEAGVPDVWYLGPDYVDDQLQMPFASGFTGDVVVLGRSGSRIKRNVTIAPGGNLNIGVTTIAGENSGVMQAIGKIVGIIAREGTFTAPELVLISQHFDTAEPITELA